MGRTLAKNWTNLLIASSLLPTIPNKTGKLYLLFPVRRQAELWGGNKTENKE